MPPRDADLAAVLSRLERLEKQQRFWKGAALLLVLALGVVSLGGSDWADVKETIRAKGFVLVDDAGKTRAELTLNKQLKQPGLVLYDAAGKQRCRVLLGKDGPEMACLDENNRFLGKFGGTGAVVQRSLRIFDTQGKARVRLTADTGDTALLLTNGQSEKMQLKVYVGENGNSHANFYDSTGQKVLLSVGAATRIQSGSIVAHDGSGNFVWGSNNANEWVAKGFVKE